MSNSEQLNLKSEDIDVKWILKSGVWQQAPALNRQSPVWGDGISVAVCTYNRHLSLERFLRSLETQSRLPQVLLIVDASTNDFTETMLKSYSWRLNEIIYLHVGHSFRGLTKQRNVALDWCTADLIAFFDDDVVMEADCLKELEVTIRNSDDIVGVGARILGEGSKPGLIWNTLHWLGAMTDLIPGKYHRSGLIAPLRLLGNQQGEVNVDRLAGCCMMWRTSIARKERFNPMFYGYAQGEDLEFSRRIAKYGRLMVSGRAQVHHFHDTQGRPDLIALGRMGIVNHHYIHRTTLLDRRLWDVLWFLYAQSLYVLLMSLSMLIRGKFVNGIEYVWGTLLGVGDVLRGAGK